MSDKTELNLEVERASFEASRKPRTDFNRKGDWYKNPVVQACWETWLEARRATTQPTVAKPDAFLFAPVACSENGVLRWMTGRKVRNCELYTTPVAPADAVRDAERLGEAVDKLEESSRLMLEWCVKNVDKWSFSQYDWLKSDHDAVKALRPAAPSDDETATLKEPTK